MKNKLLILTILTLLFSGCSRNRAEDPLLLPPDFNEMPDLNNPEKPAPKSPDQDAQELRDLLLKSN
ncbi:MAG: hypothetical protein K0R25_690 [Rickettsiaceae bacterium]|jgi:hypothetical protein|nr:hypothetical protein [Rickettsiaceae bacterium]